MRAVEDREREIVLELVRVTETAALLAGRCMGMGDKELVDAAAVDGMRGMLSLVNISGRVVIGEGEKDRAPMLYNGERVGTGLVEDELDIAVDPVEGTRLVADGLPNALSVIVAAARDSLMPVPTFYMHKLAVGQRARDYIDINAPVRENLRVVATALGKKVRDLTVVILNRPRHADLVREVREAGARIKFIQDGDVAGAISTSVPDTGVDMLMGTGGAPEAVLAAAALKCLGGEIQTKMWVRDAEDEARARAASFEDTTQVYTSEDLAKGKSIVFCATGITDGDMLKGVRYNGEHATTDSIVMRARTGTVRRIQTSHDLSKKTLHSFRAGREMPV
ncbi:MAG: Fructose-1,6-bisphosphatase class 2 [Firmicutes bacterium ADurb.Bin506]|nr:MAG: Fructose-1,6-bisphosphatase class 2 [Firmicutes bacterium ADurb.Bin506]